MALPEETDGGGEEIQMDDIYAAYADMYGVTFFEKDIAEYLYVYGCPLFLLLGTIGNVATIIRFVTMCQKVLSTILYLVVVAIMDLVVLYERCGNAWIKHILDYDFEEASMHWSNTVCKIYPFLSNFAYHLSVWLLVAMAIETTLVAFRPHRLLKIYSLERARAVFLLIIVLLVCVNAHCFWTYALIKLDKTGKSTEEVCDRPQVMSLMGRRLDKTLGDDGGDGNDNFRRVTWPIIDIILGDLLPYLIIFACTVMLITKRVKGHDRTREVDNIWRSYTCDAAAARHFHTTIMALSVFYLVLMLPKMVCNIFLFLVEPSGLWLVKYSLTFDSKKKLAKAVCMSCHYLFISAKFIIYLASSQEYRRGFNSMFSCDNCCGRRRAGGRHGGIPRNAAAPLKAYNANCNHDNEETSSLVHDKPYSITAV